MMNFFNPKRLFTMAFFIGLALFPLFSNAYGLDLILKIMVFAILTLSLELLVGSTGLICFGQAAFFGIGAYSAVLLSPQDGPASILWLLPTSMALAGLYALFVGSLSLRTKDAYFIMVTLAFAQMAYFVFRDSDFAGGSDGIYLYFRPELGSFLDMNDTRVLYGFTLACLIITFLFLAIFLRSRIGRTLAGIHENEQRMRAAGFSTYPYKLAAFVLSGVIAGLAGFLYAIKDGFVNPELMSWHLSGAALVMIILGGLGHLRGALLGAFAFTLLEEFYKSEVIFSSFAKHWHLGLGLTIIASVVLLPNGLVDVPQQLRQRLLGFTQFSDDKH